jgi:hypothetical protein
MFLPRLALIVVAWLPPCGLLLLAYLYPKKNLAVLGFARFMFVFALIITVWIFLDKEFVSDSVCTIVFARYTNPMPRYLIYGGYYQLGLLGMLFLSANGIIHCEDYTQRMLLGQLLMGSLAFIVPSLVLVIAFSATDSALASIMCHFALLLAVFLTRLLYLERRFTKESG